MSIIVMDKRNRFLDLAGVDSSTENGKNFLTSINEEEFSELYGRIIKNTMNIVYKPDSTSEIRIKDNFTEFLELIGVNTEFMSEQESKTLYKGLKISFLCYIKAVLGKKFINEPNQLSILNLSSKPTDSEIAKALSEAVKAMLGNVKPDC